MCADCVDQRFNTTRRLTKGRVDTDPCFQLPLDPQTKHEGGLRTRGLYKSDDFGPLISVITVCFNCASTIENTILSVLGQTYSNIEYIIIDGGSVDGTLDIIKKYDHAIDYWISGHDRGIYDAMNKGIALANGEWVALLNADDEYAHPDSLSQIATLPQECGVVATDVIMITQEGEKLFAVNERRPRYRNIPYMHTGMFIRRSIYENIGPYDIKYRIASDIEYIFRLLRSRAHIYYLNSPLVKMRDGGASAKHFKHGRKEYRTIYMAYGGNLSMAAYGYWSTLAEKKLYDIRLARKIFRSLRGLFR